MLGILGIHDKKRTLRNGLIFIYLLFFIFINLRFTLRLLFLIPLFLPFSFLSKKLRLFINQWGPFYIAFFFYDIVHALIGKLSKDINLTLLPNIERFIFRGSLPTLWLQQNFYNILKGPIGKVLILFYLNHFLLPIIVLYVLWCKRVKIFKIGILSFALLNFLALITFFFFPAAPPWMASQLKAIPNIERTTLFHIKDLFSILKIPHTYVAIYYNKVAPFPSLHAGYACLVFLLSRAYFRKFKLILLVNMIISGFVSVSFGEHYVIDVVAGWLYSFISFLFVKRFYFSSY